MLAVLTPQVRLLIGEPLGAAALADSSGYSVEEVREWFRFWFALRIEGIERVRSGDRGRPAWRMSWGTYQLWLQQGLPAVPTKIKRTAPAVAA